MLHMTCQMQEQLYVCYKGAPTQHLNKWNKHQGPPPANESKLLDLGVCWKCRLAGHVWVHGSKISFLSLCCLLGCDTTLLWIHEELKKKTWSTKGRSREYDANTLKCAWLLVDAKSLEMLENKRTNILRTGCLASSPSSRAVTRSCSGTPFGPRVHLPL
jgi:hypothetical protein